MSHPKPSYDIDGQQVSWTEYHAYLTRAINSIDSKIDDLEGNDSFEEHTTIVT